MHQWLHAIDVRETARSLWRQLALASNWPLLAAVAALCSVGMLTLAHVDPGAARNQAVFLLIGFLCMAVFQGVNYAKLQRFALPFYLIALALVVIVLVGGKLGLPFTPRINGAARWIRVGPISIHAAELMKIACIMWLARYLRFRDNYRTMGGLVVPILLVAIPAVLILKEPDLGTTLVFIPTTIAMLFCAGAKVRHFAVFVVVLAGALPVAWLSGQPGVPVLQHGPSLVRDYQRQRVHAMFMDTEETRRGKGFQQYYGLVAAGSGGFSGKGAGNVPVGRIVPESHNDMIFVLVGEQFGFVGSFVVIAAYLVLVAAGLEIAVGTKEPFGRLVAVGVTTALAGQAFLNLAVALKVTPVTGVTLPFVSSGGSSLIASFMAVGLLLNIGQHRPFLLSREAFDFDREKK